MNIFNSLILVFSLLSLSFVIIMDNAYGAEIECPKSSGNYFYINGSAFSRVMDFEGGEITIFYCDYEADSELEDEPYGDLYAIYNFTGELTPELIEFSKCGSTLGGEFYSMYVSSTTNFSSVAISTSGLIEAASQIMTQIEDQNIGQTCSEESIPEPDEDDDPKPEKPTLEISNEAIKEKPIEEIKKVAKKYESDQEEDIEQKTIIKLDETEIKSKKIVLPDWIKNNAEWWSKDQITDDEFYKGIEFLINNGIIRIPLTVTADQTSEIPGWVKKNAQWWSLDLISEQEFVNGLQFLISKGIINVVR